MQLLVWIVLEVTEDGQASQLGGPHLLPLTAKAEAKMHSKNADKKSLKNTYAVVGCKLDPVVLSKYDPEVDSWVKEDIINELVTSED